MTSQGFQLRFTLDVPLVANDGYNGDVFPLPLRLLDDPVTGHQILLNLLTANLARGDDGIGHHHRRVQLVNLAL